MAEPVVIEGVVLHGDDLNWTNSPWRRITRANNIRLLPIFVGFAGLGFVLSGIIQPSVAEIVLLLAPVLIGWFVFIWVTNTYYLDAYKNAYAVTPLGRAPTTFTFDVHGLRQKLERGECAYEWSAFVEVVEDQNGTFRFWMTPFMAVVLPARYVSAQQASALRALVAESRERGEIKGVPAD